MKERNYKLRSRVWAFLGYLTLASTTIGGFVLYGFATNWSQFQKDIENFVVIQEESVKLNLMVALPLLVTLLIFIWIVGRKNKEVFLNKISLSLLATLVVFYLIYSVIEITLFTLVGAFIGGVADDFIFTPMSKKNSKLALDKKDIDAEYDREKKRIQARKQAREELDGTV